MSTYNICFRGEIRKKYYVDTPLSCSYGFMKKYISKKTYLKRKKQPLKKKKKKKEIFHFIFSSHFQLRLSD